MAGVGIGYGKGGSLCQAVSENGAAICYNFLTRFDYSIL